MQQAAAPDDRDLEAGFILADTRVYPLRLVVEREGRQHKLEPRVMATLLELARAGGAVVTRQMFADTVWKGRVVSDESLSHNISALRGVLGDDARSPRCIQTVPTVGYRLIVPVSPLPTRRTLTRRTWLAAVGIAIIAALAIISTYMLFASRSLPGTTIAVLPFESLSNAREAEYFGDGLAEEILEVLTRADGLSVIARTSSFVFRDRVEDARAVGSALGAGSILEGTVRHSGNLLRVTARLVDANSGIQLWSESFDVGLEDVFEVQDEISRAIVDRLIGTLNPEPPRSPRDTDNFEAYQLYLRGNHQLYRRGPAAVARSIELYRKALDLDPEFARANVGLAQALAMMPTYLDEPELPYLEQSELALNAAESLGLDSARLVGTRAYVAFRSWRWAEADRYFRRAIAIAPNHSDIRQQYSQFLGTVGYMEQALEMARAGVQSDPLSAVAHQRLAVMYLWVDDLDLSRDHFAISEELGIGELATPEAQIALLARAGDYAAVEARLRDLQRVRSLPDDWVAPVMHALRGETGVQTAVPALTSAYEDHVIGPRLYLGALYFLGDPESYFDGLNLLISQHAAIDTEILFTPIATAIRSAPGFEPAMARMGLIEFWRDGQYPAVLAH